MEISEKTEQTSRLVEAYRIGLGLLWQDRYWALGILMLTSVLPTIAYLTVDSLELPTSFILAMALVDCLAVYLITVSCLRHLGKASLKFLNPWALATIGFGMCLWFIMNGPAVLIQATDEGAISAPLRLGLLVVVIVSIYFNLKFAFYHFPLAAQFRGSLSEALKLSASLTKSNLLLPVRVVIGPMALMVLVTGIMSAINPDGSSFELELANNILRRAILLPVVYLSTAFAALLITDGAWRDIGLDPYRSSRLSTLAFSGSPSLAKLFQPKQALVIILLGSLVWLGNGLRSFETPPKPKITIVSSSAADNLAQVQLRLEDPEFKFRGFSPSWFLIRGAEGTKISSSPTKAELELTLDKLSGDLRLEFKTEKSREELSKLKDLYLWYMNVKLIPISFQADSIQAGEE